MCTRMCPLTVEEAEAVLEGRRGADGHAIALVDVPDPLLDAYPGLLVPIYVPKEGGGLAVESATWGFAFEGRANAVFNTRIETALAQLDAGRRGMWTDAIRSGRCLVPVRAFYERYTAAGIQSIEPGRGQYRFRLPGSRAFLLAGVQRDGRFSVVTTEPNADVAPIHDRMPLVLTRGESSIWLGPGFGALAEGDRPHLDVEQEG